MAKAFKIEKAVSTEDFLKMSAQALKEKNGKGTVEEGILERSYEDVCYFDDESWYNGEVESGSMDEHLDRFNLGIEHVVKMTDGRIAVLSNKK